MSIDPYKEEREEQNNNSFTPDNNNNVNHGVLSPEQKEKNKQDQKNRRGEQERKEQRMAGSEDFQNKISGRGLDDATLNGAYTKRELRAEMQAGNFTKQDYEQLQDSGQKFNGKAQAFLDKKYGSLNSGGGNGNNNGGGSSGNNNGGSGNGGGNGGGNSGGGNGNMSHADNAIAGAKEVENIDFGKLERSIHERPLYMQAQSDMMASNIFGDMWSSGYGGTWSRGSGSRNNNDDD